MKKILLVVCLALFITACAAPASPSSSPSPSPSSGFTPDATAPDAPPVDPEMESKPIVIVGLDDNFPPMGFRDETDEIVGFDIDLAKATALRMGVEFEFQPIDWKAKELELKSKKIDILWNGLTITEERKNNMLFTQPYLKNRQVIVVKNGSPVATKADLAGKIIGLQNDSSALDAVEKDTATLATLEDIMKYDNNVLAFSDLDIGRIDAVVVDEIVAKYYITQNNANFVLLEENFGDEEYGVGFRLEDTELRDRVQAVLTEMDQDGTAAKISEKWFGDNIFLPQ